MGEFNNLLNQFISTLLTSNSQTSLELHQYACKIRNKIYGKRLFLRAVIELSNYCDCNCCYCGMRRENSTLRRNRLNYSDVTPVIDQIYNLGITTIMLQAGQDSDYTTEDLCCIIKYAREIGIKNIILCLGIRTKSDYMKLSAAGANKYIMKFETSNAALYRSVKLDSSLMSRLKHILLLRKLGYVIGSGNICGLPRQGYRDLANDLILLNRLKPDMASVSPFISNSHSPYKNMPNGDVDLTLNIIALMRIMLKNVLIPSVSALETLRSGGLLAGLNAGANVATINMTPRSFRDGYMIYDEERKIIDLKLVKEVAETAGLKLSTDPE